MPVWLQSCMRSKNASGKCAQRAGFPLITFLPAPLGNLRNQRMKIRVWDRGAVDGMRRVPPET